MAEAYLANLPAELLYRIFHYCDARTIFRNIGSVCKRLRAVVSQYKQIELEFNWLTTRDIKQNFRVVPLDAVHSLVLSFDYVTTAENQMRTLLADIPQLEHLRKLSLLAISDEHLQLFLENLNYTQLVTLRIVLRDKATARTVSLLAAMVVKCKHLQQISWTSLNHRIEHLASFAGCKITHLTINSCLYSEYLAILHHFSSLRTLQLNTFVVDTDAMHVVSSPLRYLIIHECSLSTEHLRLLVSKLTALRHLKVTFRQKQFDSLVEISAWETFVRTELTGLDRLEFFLSYTLASDEMVDLQSLVLPFQEAFWLKKKRWFVASEYNCNRSRVLSLFTIPNTYGAYHSDYYGLQHEILFKQESYYITAYSRRKLQSTAACDVSRHEDVSAKCSFLSSLE